MILSNNDTTNGQHKPMPNGDLNEGAIADAPPGRRNCWIPSRDAVGVIVGVGR